MFGKEGRVRKEDGISPERIRHRTEEAPPRRERGGSAASSDACDRPNRNVTRPATRPKRRRPSEVTRAEKEEDDRSDGGSSSVHENDGDGRAMEGSSREDESAFDARGGCAATTLGIRRAGGKQQRRRVFASIPRAPWPSNEEQIARKILGRGTNSGDAGPQRRGWDRTRLYWGTKRRKRGWQSRVWRNGKQRHVGTFEYEAEAALAYDVASRMLRGPGGHVNFLSREDYASSIRGERELAGQPDADVEESFMRVAAKVRANTTKLWPGWLNGREMAPDEGGSGLATHAEKGKDDSGDDGKDRDSDEEEIALKILGGGKPPVVGGEIFARAEDSGDAGPRRGGRGGTRPYRGTRRRTSGWQSRVGHNGKQRYVGTFESEAEAALAYDIASRTLIGPGGHVNFPDREDYARAVLGETDGVGPPPAIVEESFRRVSAKVRAKLSPDWSDGLEGCRRDDGSGLGLEGGSDLDKDGGGGDSESFSDSDEEEIALRIIEEGRPIGAPPAATQPALGGENFARTEEPGDAGPRRGGHEGIRLYTGTWRNNSGWVARVGHDRRSLHLGVFKREADAALAHDVAARMLRGAGRVVNFPSREFYAWAVRGEGERAGRPRADVEESYESVLAKVKASLANFLPDGRNSRETAQGDDRGRERPCRRRRTGRRAEYAEGIRAPRRSFEGGAPRAHDPRGDGARRAAFGESPRHGRRGSGENRGNLRHGGG